MIASALLGFAFLQSPNGVDISEVRDGDKIQIVANLSLTTCVTVDLTYKLENMSADTKLPIRKELTSGGKHVLCTFTTVDHSKEGKYTWHYDWKLGTSAPKVNLFYAYHLPYEGPNRRVMQGPHGKFSHGPGTQDEEAVDFEMPIGTTIVAARPGIVVATRADSNVGGPDPKYKPDDNYVVIRHDDGSYADYVHLKQNGVLVKVGDQVRMDQPIGLSGNTGFTTAPHLHFVVFETVTGKLRRTIPARFIRPIQ